MTNQSCPSCTRPLLPPLVYVGLVGFCSTACRGDWFASGHDRRRLNVGHHVERRAS